MKKVLTLALILISSLLHSDTVNLKNGESLLNVKISPKGEGISVQFCNGQVKSFSSKEVTGFTRNLPDCSEEIAKQKELADKKIKDARKAKELKEKHEETRQAQELKEKQEREKKKKEELARKQKRKKPTPTKEKEELVETNTPSESSEKESGGVIIPPSTVSGKSFTNSIGMEMVEIPAGEFMMGCSQGDTDCGSNEKPAHKVKITKSFYMGKYEVTQGQWQTVMGDNPSYFKDCGKNCPVEQVSWNDVQKFLKKLNTVPFDFAQGTDFIRVKDSDTERSRGVVYRLPTEAEWEYAARGSTSLTNRATTKYYANDLNSIAWYDMNSGDKTHPVGQRNPNAFGLYDMLGNVYEWTGDWYDEKYYSKSPSNDPTGSESGSYRVLRGGSWHDRAQICRSSYRYDDAPVYRNSFNGFRVVSLP